MTNPTPHGQVPEALIDLIDAYAETRHRCGGIYNAKTEAARKAVIEALSGVQALSAAPKAAPQQEEPVAWLSPWRADQVTTDPDAYGKHGIPLVRQQPAPAPAPLSDVVQKTWALLDELEKLRGADRYDEDWVTLNKRDDELRAALDAHGGKA